MKSKSLMMVRGGGKKKRNGKYDDDGADGEGNIFFFVGV